MSEDPDRDTQPERRTNVVFDNWPVERPDAYEDWPVEREASAGDTFEEEVDPDWEWIGYAGKRATEAQQPVIFHPETGQVTEAELDEENERIVIRDDHAGQQVESEESLGERIEEWGEQHGWTWLADFARDHLEDDEEVATVPEPEHTDFTRRNLLDDADQDLAFVASHTYRDADDRVVTLEREFDVFLESARARVLVEEEILVAEDSRAEERAGDADIVEENQYELAFDLDPDDPTPEGAIEGDLKEWHATYPTPQRGE